MQNHHNASVYHPVLLLRPNCRENKLTKKFGVHPVQDHEESQQSRTFFYPNRGVEGVK